MSTSELLWRSQKKSRKPTNRLRDSEPQALPVHPWSEQNGRSRDRSGGAQILGSRLTRAAVRDYIEADILPLVEGAHAGALDCADMYEDVLPAIGRLNKPKALLAVKPLHSSLIHSDVLSLTVCTWGWTRKDSAPVSRFVDFGEVSETCAPVSNEAKRPSCSAKYRSSLYRVELGLLQGRSVRIVNRTYRAVLAREALNDGFVVG